MPVTVEDVHEALRRLRKLRREVIRQRASAKSHKQVERLHELMESIQRSEKERLDVLERVKRGEKIY